MLLIEGLSEVTVKLKADVGGSLVSFEPKSNTLLVLPSLAGVFMGICGELKENSAAGDFGIAKVGGVFISIATEAEKTDLL